MFCRKCGQQISGNEKFCPGCGAPVVKIQQGNQVPPSGNARQGNQAPPPGNTRQGGQTAPKKRPPYLAIGLIAAIIIVVIVAVKLLLPSDNYEKPVENMMKAMETQDAKLLMKTMPDELYDYMADEMGMDRDQIEEQLEYVVSEIAEDYDGKVKIKYEIEDAQKLKKSQISEIEEELNGCITVEEGKRLDLYMEIYIDGEQVEEYDETIDVIKVGRKWYLDPTSF